MRVGLVESDPLRVIGYGSVFEDSANIGIVVTTIGGLLDDHSFSVGVLAQHRGSNIQETVAILHQMRPDLKLLVVGSGDEDDSIPPVLVRGALGYLDEQCSLREFRQAVEAVSAGMLWVPPRLRTKAVNPAPPSTSIAGGHGGFHITQREQQVLDRLVEAGSNREIAQVLGIEERTVKGHVSRLMRKIGVGNRTALSLYALKQFQIR